MCFGNSQMTQIMVVYTFIMARIHQTKFVVIFSPKNLLTQRNIDRMSNVSNSAEELSLPSVFAITYMAEVLCI